MTAPTIREEDLERYKVRLTHPDHHKKVLFRSISKTRAEAFLKSRFPRGSEAYIEYPDGRTFSHEAERQGDMGADADVWAEFDPESWQPPASAPPPGDNVWSDKEG